MYCVRFCWLICWLLLAGAQPAFAQHPYYYTITDDNGLPSNEVYDIEQDDFGYVWVGCDAGLYRYDGFRFTQFKNKDQNAVAISTLRFSANKSKLFCQNFFGQVYCVENDSMHIYADVKDKVKGHPEYSVGAEDKVVLNFRDSILCYNSAGKYDSRIINDTAVDELEITKDGDLYIMLSSGVLKRHPRLGKNLSAEYVVLPEGVSYKHSTHAIRSFGQKQYMLSVGFTTFILTIIQGNQTLFVKQIAKAGFAERVYAFLPEAGYLWLCTSNGVYMLDTSGNQLNHYFPGEKISDMLVDREGAYWFSSLQKGLFIVPHIDMSVLHSGNAALSDDNFTALCPFGERGVLAGTYRGDVYLFSHQDHTLQKLPGNTKHSNNVTTIYPYNDHTILAARGGLSVINLQKMNEQYLQAMYIRDMVLYHDSIMFVSTSSASAVKASQLVENTASVVPHVLAATSGKKVCYEAESNTLWYILNTGLAVHESGVFKPYVLEGKPIFCNALYADEQGLWAGTVSDGVYNIRGRKVHLHLNEQNGLIGNNIKCFTSHADTLYIATNACINVRYPDGTFRYIRHANGINAKEINAMCVAPPHIYIGTLRGLFYVPTTTIFYNKVKPRMRILSVLADGVPQAGTNIALDYNNKDILISFSSVALKSRGRFFYHYRIAGLQDEWKHLEGSNNSLRLNHLPKGTFTLQLKAVNEDGVESDVQSVSIHVSPPFWQRTIFYVLVALSVALLMGGIFLIRIRAIKRLAGIREQITSSQLTALKAQMNPHFMYNTLNSIQDLVLQKDIRKTNYYLSKYSTLMRKILDSSGSNEIDIAEEIDMLQLYLELEQLRFGSEFSYSIRCSPQISQGQTSIPSMIIQPFVENAIKHGLLHKKEDKNVSVSFEKVAGYIRCVIIDNGVGRKRAEEINKRSGRHHRSFATQATQKRLDLINVGKSQKVLLTITDLFNDGQVAGTKVILDFPDNTTTEHI